MDIESSAETPVRVTADRVKNPKRQEHMKRVNVKKKEIELQMEKELELDPPESKNYLVISMVLVAICGILYVHQKYAPTASMPMKNELVSNVKETIKEIKFSDF